jgi:hypothetical protein
LLFNVNIRITNKTLKENGKATPLDPRIAPLKEAIQNKEKMTAQTLLIALGSEGILSKEEEANDQKMIDGLPLA